MKKIIVALALMVFTIGNAAIAGEKEIDKRVKQAFEREFAGAADVTWHAYDDHIQVDFTFKDMRLIGYYSNAGETLGLVRNIGFLSLPLMLQFDLKKNYKDYWITQIFELANKEGTRYHLTLESADKIMKLRSNGTDDWEIIGKKDK